MTPPASVGWHTREGGIVTLARNVGSRYILLAVNVLIGLVTLPFNVAHLGQAAYGLWMLSASITMYFTVLELGYGSAVVKFVAEYRAKKDARALNEIVSTIFFVFAGMGVLAYGVAIVVAVLMPHIFNLAPDQIQTGRVVLLIIAVQVAMYLPFSVFGGVMNGFERYYINNMVGTVFDILTAAVNILVLWSGYGLFELVLATTFMRIVPFWIYRHNAHKAFPELSIRRQYFRVERIRELTGFSAYMAVIDWSSRLTYMTDTFYIGIFLNTAAVGVYAIAQQLSNALLRLTHQLHTFLFPAVVHRAVGGEMARQQDLMVKAGRFQLAVAVCMCGGVAAVADVLIRAWVGSSSDGAIQATQILAFVVALRAWSAMPSTVLKGSGHQKAVAIGAVACAVANLLLSIPLVKMWGLPGVALGTAIPVAALSAGFLFPRACRVVGLPVAAGYRLVVWPAVWPAAITMAFLWTTREMVPLRMAAVLAHLAVGGLMYAVLFFMFGLGREERRWFASALNQVWRRRSPGLAAA